MSTPSIVPSSDAFTGFVLWILDQLQYPWTAERGIFRVQIPESDQSAFDGRTHLTFQVSGNEANAQAGEDAALTPAVSETDVVTLSPDSQLFRSLLHQLNACKHVVCSQPREQINRLHQIAERLFPAYSVLEGHIHLAGCSLEDRPFLRLTYLRSGQAESTAGKESSVSLIVHLYFDAEGNQLTDQQAIELGLAELVPAEEVAAHLSDADFDQMVSLAQEHVTSPSTGLVETNPSSLGNLSEPIMATVIWCKYVEGMLGVTIGESGEKFPFAGWANLIQPEPLKCPQTGELTHAFAATSKGIIAAASQIGRCTETGKRELKRELVACSVSGKLALPERIVTCPVSEEPVLRSVLIECPVCHQEVSPDVLTRGICRACAAPPRVSKSDARLARVLGEYPRLDFWSRWKLSETATVYIAQASSLLKRLLLVLNKQTLEVQHMATGNAVTRRWQPVPAEQWESYLHSGSEEES